MLPFLVAGLRCLSVMASCGTPRSVHGMLGTGKRLSSRSNRWLPVPQRNPTFSSQGSGHTIPPNILENLVPLHVRDTVVSSSTDGCNLDGWMDEIVKGADIMFTDSSRRRLRRRAVIRWEPGSPSQVLIVKKPRNLAASERLREIGAWLQKRGLKVVVERAVHATETPQFEAYDPEQHNVDFCITLGGDGTVLHLASLFEQDEPLPPVISFAMGTLGFLTPFEVDYFEHCLTRVMNSDKQPLFCTLRTRKRCEIQQEGKVLAQHNVLNEVVIDRGAFPGAVLLELFIDGHFVTNIEADGLIMATPSGSTAYSMSAGGPMVAPSVPCTILTPIAPLSLSFRPLVIPESSDIVINLPSYARSYARASFDGKKPMRLRKETTISVTTSLCPLPMINLGTLDSDWYEGITQKLKWNQTIRSPPKMPVVSHATANGWNRNVPLSSADIVNGASKVIAKGSKGRHEDSTIGGSTSGSGSTIGAGALSPLSSVDGIHPSLLPVDMDATEFARYRR